MRPSFRRNGSRLICFLTLGAVSHLGLTADAQQQATPQIQIRQAPRQNPQAGKAARQPVVIEQSLLDAWGRNPDTIGARITAIRRDGKVVLKGRVATKQVHDSAVQTAIGLGLPFVDELVIDTAEAQFQARPATVSAVGPTALPAQGWGSAVAASPYGPFGAYLYPPPLLGRVDDPFFGLEPPVISYPLDWAARVARRPAADPRTVAGAPANDLPDNTVVADIDPNGVAILNGRVPTLADKVAVGQKLLQTEGVTQVINRIEVATDRPVAVAAPAPTPGGTADEPPPPPRPRAVPSRANDSPKPETATPPPAVVPDPPAAGVATPPAAMSPLEGRVRKAIAAVPALGNEPIRIQVRDGLVTVAGRMASAYEAMLAYRAVQKTPGVRDIVDLLHFPLPEEAGPNPLIQSGRPEDVEPYLLVQIRRNVDDMANVDRVSVVGDTLTIQGTLADESDRARFFSVLRSMPLLRGFKVNARVTAAAG